MRFAGFADLPAKPPSCSAVLREWHVSHSGWWFFVSQNRGSFGPSTGSMWSTWVVLLRRPRFAHSEQYGCSFL